MKYNCIIIGSGPAGFYSALSCSKKRLEEANIDIYMGDGEFIDSNTFLINDKRLEADYFIIATGSSPESLPGIPLDGKNIISHYEAMALSELPENMVIIGGNVEGVEMAVLFASLGVTVTVIEQLYLLYRK